MKVCIIRGANQFPAWVDALEKADLKFQAIEPEEIYAFCPEKYAALISCSFQGLQFNKTMSKILLECSMLGIPTYPTLQAHLLYNDKATQSREFRRLDLPVPFTRVFLDRYSALNWLADAEYPVVCKTSAGAASGGVLLVKTRKEAEAIINRAFTNGRRVDSYPPEVSFRRLRSLVRFIVSETSMAAFPPFRALSEKHSTLRGLPYREQGHILFQQFIPGSNFDYRVSVIGDKAFCMRRFNREGDFRASGSDRRDLSPESVPECVIELGFRAAARLGMNQILFADIISHKGRPLLVETSYISSNPHLVHPGYWDRNMEWHSENVTRFQATTDFLFREIRAYAGESLD